MNIRSRKISKTRQARDKETSGDRHWIQADEIYNFQRSFSGQVKNDFWVLMTLLYPPTFRGLGHLGTGYSGSDAFSKLQKSEVRSGHSNCGDLT